MAKGRDLEDAAVDVDLLNETKSLLKQALSSYGDRLETIRERIEGAARLHHLLALDLKEKDVQLEMQRLAEKIGAVGLVERCRDTSIQHSPEPVTSTPSRGSENSCSCWRNESFESDSGKNSSTDTSVRLRKRSMQLEQKANDNSQDDDEDHSKMADSGLGGCDRCEGNDKLVRTCSCQSFDEPATACSKRYGIKSMRHLLGLLILATSIVLWHD